STAPALPSPSASLPQPDWKNAITTPNDAAAANRFITAVVSGTTTLRNATSSSRKARPTMTTRNSGSLPAMTWSRSAWVRLSASPLSGRVVTRCDWLTRLTFGVSAYSWDSQVAQALLNVVPGAPRVAAARSGP